MGSGFRRRIEDRARAVRSQLRRYPREISQALRETREAPAIRTGAADSLPLGSTPIDAFESVWLGHATALVRVGQTSILTDPVLSHRIGPRLAGRTLGPARLRHAPADARSLRGVDVLLLSHAHFDHLDLPSLEALADTRTTIVTARGTRRLIPAGFRRVIELPWRRTVRLGDVEITALEADHWGARHALDRWRRHNAYFVEHRQGRVLFAGDTAATDAFDPLPRVDLAMLGIGAYEGWRHRHATPEEAWDMFRRMRARAMMATHHATFDMGERTPDEPMQRLLSAAGAAESRIVCREPGSTWTSDETAA